MLLKSTFFILIAILLASCSTQRNTWLSRNYNSLTARYNTLFNGVQSFRAGEENLINSHRDNFTNILYIFPFSGPDKAGLSENYMSRAIEKGVEVVRERSITARPNRKPSQDNSQAIAFYNKREFNRYVDDAFLLIGKAHLYNHDFNEAIAAFEQATREFPGEAASFEAVIWMARARIEMGDHENALLLLNRYDAMGQAPSRLFGEYMATYADHLIRSGQYQAAIPFMTTAAREAKGRWNRSRRLYILAQLYHRSGQYQLAQQYYNLVARTRPGHEMELNARVNYMLIEGMLTDNHASSRASLYRLANQSKNRDQRDLIYHGLAQSYLRQGETGGAIVNLTLSAGYNRDNEALRLETYLQLADLFFLSENFSSAFAYQDSSLTLIPGHDPRLEKVRHRHSGLRSLTTHLDIISREDSLQRLAKMPRPELENFITAMIEQARQNQLNQAAINESGAMRQGFDPMFGGSHIDNLSQQPGGQGQWYFFNPATVSLGKMEFERRWGRRANEDNWRRANKGAAEGIAAAQPEGIPGEPGINLIQEYQEAGLPANNLTHPHHLATMEDLLANVPLNQEHLERSENMVAEARFEAGMVFYNHFKDFENAAEMFYKMASLKPDHPLAEQGWFWGYLSYKNLEQPEGTEKMKRGLLRAFPGGKYAPFVIDPRHAERLLTQNDEFNRLYEQAYTLYLNNKMEEALAIADSIINATTNEELWRQATLLSAIIKGKTGNLPEFRSSLTSLVETFPQTDEGVVATRWLAMLDSGRHPVAGAVPLRRAIDDNITIAGVDRAISPDQFTHNPDDPHKILLIVNASADINRLIFNIADYNFSHFLLADYEINTLTLPDGQKLITIGEFVNQRESMDYFFRLRSAIGVFAVPNIETAQLMAGTAQNINTLVATGALENYREYFSRLYLQGSQGMNIPVGNLSRTPQPAHQDQVTREFAQVNEGSAWAMIIIPNNADFNRIAGFLSGLAFNQFRLNVNTRLVRLSGGESVVIVESFASETQAGQFISSLKTNNHWNNQIRAATWFQSSVSPENFKLIEAQGSTEKFKSFRMANPI